MRYTRAMPRSSRQKIGVITVLLGCSPATAATGQVARPSVDSLVATFIEQGILAQWQPYQLFRGCPDLDSRQRRGISLLMSANLSPGRTDELASAWASPLKRCADPTLEQWYFDTFSGLIRDGKSHYLSRYRLVLGKTATPAVQSYLRSLMLDPTMPEDVRTWAGLHLVQQLQGRAVRAEWQLAFESEAEPWEVLRYATKRLLSEDPGWLLPGLAQRIRNNPGVTDSPRLQVIFYKVAQDGSPAQRETIARAVEDVAARVPEDRRANMRAFADWLRKGIQNDR
jgi:hypothetical protein